MFGYDRVKFIAPIQCKKKNIGLKFTPERKREIPTYGTYIGTSRNRGRTGGSWRVEVDKRGRRVKIRPFAATMSYLFEETRESRRERVKNLHVLTRAHASYKPSEPFSIARTASKNSFTPYLAGIPHLEVSTRLESAWENADGIVTSVDLCRKILTRVVSI